MGAFFEGREGCESFAPFQVECRVLRVVQSLAGQRLGSTALFPRHFGISVSVENAM
jgi:hypothetical protein